jgi:ABC-type uncharacterized transport system fused permease/ATPase subunit
LVACEAELNAKLRRCHARILMNIEEIAFATAETGVRRKLSRPHIGMRCGRVFELKYEKS